MTDEDAKPEDLSRRLFMRETAFGATAAAGAAAASTTAAAQPEDEDDEENGEDEEEDENGDDEEDEEDEEEDVEPDWPNEVEDANGFDDTDDQRGEDEVTIQVGGGDDGLAFEPAAVWIDPETEITWEWTGEGGGHNVNSLEGEDFQSDTEEEEGFTFEHTFEEEEINVYECTPHAGQGMNGGVAVGEDIDTQEVMEDVEDDSGGGVELPDSARAVGVALTVAFGSTLGLTYVFMKYGGDYEGDRIE